MEKVVHATVVRDPKVRAVTVQSHGLWICVPVRLFSDRSRAPSRMGKQTNSRKTKAVKKLTWQKN